MFLDTTLTVHLRACEVVGKYMPDPGHGRITNITLRNSFGAFHEVAADAASKSGVSSLTQPLGIEWSRKDVAVNAIALGVFPTALNEKLLRNTHRDRELLMRYPMGRLGKIGELVGVAVILTSDGGFLASYANQWG